MFSLMADLAIEESNRLESQAAGMRSCLWELEQVMQELGGLSQMDGLVAGLARQYREMDDEYRVLKGMAFALDGAVSAYVICENRICDYAGQNMLQERKRVFGRNIGSFKHNIAIPGMEGGIGGSEGDNNQYVDFIR